MNKIPCTSQNIDAKTLLVDVCIFGRFGRLSPAAFHSDDCQFDSGGKLWIHVSSIVTYLCKKIFLLHWNSFRQRSKSLTHRLFLIDCEQMRQPLSTQLSHWQMYMQNNEYIAFWYHQPLLSHATSICNWPKRVCGVFWCFPGQPPNLGNLSVQRYLCQCNRIWSQHTTS